MIKHIVLIVTSQEKLFIFHEYICRTPKTYESQAKAATEKDHPKVI